MVRSIPTTMALDILYFGPEQGCPIVAMSHRHATEALKRATGQIQQVLLNSANYQIAWPVEPFIYSQIYHFMQILLNL